MSKTYEQLQEEIKKLKAELNHQKALVKGWKKCWGEAMKDYLDLRNKGVSQSKHMRWLMTNYYGLCSQVCRLGGHPDIIDIDYLYEDDEE